MVLILNIIVTVIRLFNNLNKYEMSKHSIEKFRMNKWFFLLSIGLANYLGGTDGANILGILPTVATSHHIVGTSLLKGLAKAGHTVTVISAFPMKETLQNYKGVELTGFFEMNAATGNPDLFKFKGKPAVMTLLFVYQSMGLDTCNFITNHPNVVALKNSGEKFDLVIVETFATESLYGFGQHFDAPVITFSTFGASKWTNDLVGTPAPLSYIPHTFLSFTDKMSFWQRFGNAALAIAENIYYDQVYLPKQKKIYDKAFPNAKITFAECQKNISLVLLNHHFSMAFPRPYQPNMIEVGGMQINKPKPLPENLEKYISSSKHGVIYFSMGSMLQGTNFPEAKRNAMVKAFGKLKQNVLWKYENETLPNKPDNVMIQKWMPQNDILAHPNVKLFITHGGLGGTTEALFYGVPLVGIPIFGDQALNIAKAEQSEYGVKLEYDELTEETALAAIKNILDNPKYNANAKSISEKFRDKPLSSLDTAIYWVEYVIRHKGAPHLKSASMNLSFIELNMIDVIIVMLIMAVLVLALQIMIVKKVFKKIFESKKVEKKKNN